MVRKPDRPQQVHEGQDTAAALVLGEGVPVPIIIHLLGHTDSSITLKVYAHMPPDHAGTQHSLGTVYWKRPRNQSQKPCKPV